MTVANLGSCKKCDAADLIKKLGLEFAIYKREYIDQFIQLHTCQFNQNYA